MKAIFFFAFLVLVKVITAEPSGESSGDAVPKMPSSNENPFNGGSQEVDNNVGSQEVDNGSQESTPATENCRQFCASFAADDKKQLGEPIAKQAELSHERVRVVVIGGGVAGHTAMHEMSRVGIGNKTNPGASGNTGLLLLEKGKHRVCGIIDPITFPESSGLDANPFGTDYRPYRLTTHAMRINIATMPSMRCLAHELNMTLYFSPWATEYRLNGYVARNKWMSASSKAPKSLISSGFGSTAKAVCEQNFTTFLSHRGCGVFNGAGDLVKQTTATPENGAAYNLWNYDPANNYNFNLGDPEYEWYGWALGWPSFYNPTANYSGNGRAYNNASVFPFNPKDRSQDHPRHRCRDYADLYTLYLHYLGPAYASFICSVNVGFLGDCFSGATSACQYLGSSEETGWQNREMNTLDEGYPVGSFTEFCTRQAYLTKHNQMGVKTEVSTGDAVTVVDKNTANSQHGAYTVKTASGRVIYADEVVIATEPEALSKMSGSIANSITSHKYFQDPAGVACITVNLHWSSKLHVQPPILNDLISSWRMLNPNTCLNRVELLNTPYHRNGKMNAMRAVYSDYNCLNTLLALAKIDDPDLSKYNAETGFPINGSLATNIMKELRQVLTGEGPYDRGVNVVIPDPDRVVFVYTPNCWYYTKPGSTATKMAELSNWAMQPLAKERVTLVQQAWNVQYSGWAVASVKQTRQGLLKLFGAPFFTKTAIEKRENCQEAWKTDTCKASGGRCDENWDVVADNPCPVDALPTQKCSKPADLYALEPSNQYGYADGLPNERFPPYTWTQPIEWQPGFIPESTTKVEPTGTANKSTAPAATKVEPTANKSTVSG